MRKLNLNLLKALEAILTEQNVSRAAQKLFITQPAMSNVLSQLRDIFKDKLLVRAGKGMTLTPLALRLVPKIKFILKEIEKTVYQQEIFDPQTLSHTFKLGLSDYAEFVLLSPLIEKISKIAPHVSIQIKNLNHVDNPALFESEEIDIGVGILNGKLSSALSAQVLFTEKAVCVARKDHLLMQEKLTLKKYCQAKHLAIVYQKNAQATLTEMSLNNHNISRKITLATPHILPTLHVLAKSDLIATVPYRLALGYKKYFNLCVQEPPFSIPNVTVHLVWHNKDEDDPKAQWLRKMIKKISETL